MINNKVQVYNITKKLITSLKNDLESSYTKAILAKLRNSINYNNNQIGFTLQFLFERLPQNFLDSNGVLTNTERAILNTLQLYALHQQGKSLSVDSNRNDNLAPLGNIEIQFYNNKFFIKSKLPSYYSKFKVFYSYNDVINYINHFNTDFQNDSKEDKYQYINNVGQSLGEFRIKNNNTTAIDRRFNSMITADTYNELIHHLRYLVRLVKSNADIKINYPKLASDLYFFLSSINDQNKVKLSWAKSYYSQRSEENNNEK